MKTEVRYCQGCEEIIRRGKCGCSRRGFSTDLQPLNFQGGRIIRRAIIITALAGIGWLVFTAITG